MDNAPRALIMAGEILIAIMVVSLFTVIVTVFGNFSSNTNAKLAQSRITAFNSKFYKFQYRIDISAQEVASAINYAKESNDENDLNYIGKINGTSDESDKFIRVYIGNTDWFKSIGNDNYSDNNKFKSALQNWINVNNDKCFKCDIGDVSVTKQPSDDNPGTIKTTEKSGDSDIQIDSDTGLVNQIIFTVVKDKNYNFNTRHEFIIE